MIKFEFEATINPELENEFNSLDIENVDILDEDDDGLIVWGIIHNENDLQAFKSFFQSNPNAITNVFVEHEFKNLFNAFITFPSSDDQFAIEIDDHSAFEKMIEIISK